MEDLVHQNLSRHGAGRLILDFYNNTDLGVKRRELDGLCSDIRKKFNISILEVADFDDHERCAIGFALVIPENWKTKNARDLVEKVCKTIDSTSFARVTVEECDLLWHGSDSEKDDD